MNILHLAPSSQEKSGITDYAVVFDKILEKEGIRIIKAEYLSVNRSTWWLPFDFLFRRQYWDDLLNSIDIIHAEIGIHQAREILTLYFLRRRRRDSKIFITFHDPGAVDFRIFKIFYNISGSLFSKILSKVADQVEPLVDSLLFKGLMKYIFEGSSRIFVFNLWGRHQLSARYPRIKKKIVVINHPVFDHPKERIKQIVRRNIVYAGFWSSYKGIETLVNAYSLLVKKQKDRIPRLILAGETQIPNSSYSRMIRGLVNSLKVENLVDFPGFLKEDELFEILSQSFLVIPYTDKISGSASGIYIRGLQVGAVTVISDNPTLLSFDRGSRVSLIFKQGDAEDLNKKLLEALQNEKLAYRLAKSGQDFIYRYGRWNDLGQLIVQAYKS